MTTDELAKRFALLKEQKEAHEHAADIIGAELEDLGLKLFGAFQTASLENLRVAGASFKDGKARIVTPTLKYAPSVKDEKAFFAWLRSTDNGALIKETVHPSALSSFVTKSKEGNKPLPSENILAVYTVETATVRRAPKGKE